MALVLQVIVTGLAAGAGYGLLAIGFALVHRLTGVVHLALGELVALSVVTTLFGVAGADLLTSSSVPAGRFVGAAAGGIAFAALLGVLTYLAAIRPFLRRGLDFGWIASTVAIAFAVHGLVAAVLVRDSYVLLGPIPFERFGTRGVLDLGSGVTVPVRAFFVIAVGVLLAEAAARLLGGTRTGRAMRAVATEPDGAHLTGLPVDRLLSAAFALAGVLAAVAAIVQAPSVPFTADTGALLGL
jgi:branched-subunit amino acid ABC-type transport system permease component